MRVPIPPARASRSMSCTPRPARSTSAGSIASTSNAMWCNPGPRLSRNRRTTPSPVASSVCTAVGPARTCARGTQGPPRRARARRSATRARPRTTDRRRARSRRDADRSRASSRSSSCGSSTRRRSTRERLDRLHPAPPEREHMDESAPAAATASMRSRAAADIAREGDLPHELVGQQARRVRRLLELAARRSAARTRSIRVAAGRRARRSRAPSAGTTPRSNVRPRGRPSSSSSIAP